MSWPYVTIDVLSEGPQRSAMSIRCTKLRTLSGIFAAAGVMLLAGCASLGRAYRGPPTDHFDGKRFHNPSPSPDGQIGDVLRREVHTVTGARGH